MFQWFEKWQIFFKKHHVRIAMVTGAVMVLLIIGYTIWQVFSLIPSTIKVTEDLPLEKAKDSNWREKIGLQELIDAYSIFTPVGDILDSGAATSSAELPNTYTVQPGDSLEKIALKVYNDPTKVSLIIQANKIKRINHIEPGQVLIIP